MKTLQAQSDLMTELNDLKNRVKALEEFSGRNLLLDSNKLEMNQSDGSDEDGSTNKGLTVNEGDHFSVTPQRIQGNIYNNGGFKTSVPRVQGEVYTFSIEVNTQQDVQ